MTEGSQVELEVPTPTTYTHTTYMHSEANHFHFVELTHTSFPLCRVDSYKLLFLSILGATPPSTGLYFVFNKTVYLPGDTLRITDIGSAYRYNYIVTDPQFSLVCISTNVYNVGEWLFPNGSMVPNGSNGDFTSLRSSFTQQIFMNRQNYASVTPFGVYTCRVPDGRNSSVIHSAGISLLLCK